MKNFHSELFKNVLIIFMMIVAFSLCVWQRILKFRKNMIAHKNPQIHSPLNHHSQCTEEFKYLYGKFHFIFPRVNKVDSKLERERVDWGNREKKWRPTVNRGGDCWESDRRVKCEMQTTQKRLSRTQQQQWRWQSAQTASRAHWYLNSRANQQQVKSCLMCHMGERIRR